LPSPGGKTTTPRIINFTVLVEAFLLYISMHSVCGCREDFLKIGQFWVVFATPPRTQGHRDNEIHNFFPPSPIDVISPTQNTDCVITQFKIVCKGGV
jgi:hypothetical protein